VSLPTRESAVADTLKFTEDHLWVRVEGSRAQIGISEFGQNEIGEVIAVEVPDVGDDIEKGEPFGEIETVRTVSELISPLSGSITAVNGELEDHARLVNEDPLHEGWLIEVEMTDESELEDLMDLDEYEEYAAGEDEG
jgi:glycine cleavage system H protein